MEIRLDHCVIHVSDRPRANVFYREILGAELVGDPDGVAMYWVDEVLQPVRQVRRGSQRQRPAPTRSP